MIGEITDDFPTIGLIWLYLIGPHRLPETESFYWEEAALSHFATPGLRTGHLGRVSPKKMDVV